MADDSPKPPQQPLDYVTPPPRRPWWDRSSIWIAACVGMAVWLFIILLPSIQRALLTSPKPPCHSRMRTLGQAMLLYADSHEGRFPDRLEDLLLTNPFVEPRDFICPSTTDTPVQGSTRQEQAANLSAGGHCSYVYIGKGLTNKATSEVPVLYEPPSNHSDICNILYADGHVEFIDARWFHKVLATTRPTTAPITAEVK